MIIPLRAVISKCIITTEGIVRTIHETEATVEASVKASVEVTVEVTVEAEIIVEITSERTSIARALAEVKIRAWESVWLGVKKPR
jgi:hypothetical protein